MKQTLSKLFHHHWQNKDTIHSSAIFVAKVMIFWAKARIPTKTEHHEETKITNQNATQMMTIEEDKQFLLAQRAGRQGCMLSVDQKLTTEKKIAQRRAKEKGRKKKEETRKETSAKVTLTSKKPDENSDTHFKDDASEKDSEFEGIKLSTNHSENEEHTPKNAKIAKLMTPEFKARRENKKLAEKDKQEFNPNMPFFVHWDGKLLPDVTNVVHEKVAWSYNG